MKCGYVGRINLLPAPVTNCPEALDPRRSCLV